MVDRLSGGTSSKTTRRAKETVFDRYFKAATGQHESKAFSDRAENELGGDMIGDGKPKSARFDFNAFLNNLEAKSGKTITKEQIKERITMRRNFWYKLQEYLDEYKLHEEKYR